MKAKEESASLALSLRKEKVQKLANQLSSLQLMESEARKTSLAVGQEVTVLQSQVVDLVESLEASKKEAREAKEKLRLQKAKVGHCPSLILPGLPLFAFLQWLNGCLYCFSIRSLWRQGARSWC